MVQKFLISYRGNNIAHSLITPEVENLIDRARDLGLITRPDRYGEEETLEDLHRTLVAIDKLTEKNIPFEVVSDINSYAQTNIHTLQGTPIIGALPTTEHDKWLVSGDSSLYSVSATSNVDKYYTFTTFQDFAARDVIPMSVCDRRFLDESESTELLTLQEAADKLIEQGIYTFFVKNSESKGLIVRGPLTDIEDQIKEYEPLHYASHLIQPEVRFHYEYRVFVVGHTPVTGAGRVLSHSSLNNNGKDFMDIFTKNPSNGTPGEPTETNSTLAHRFEHFAHVFARRFRDENPDLPNYCVDFGICTTTSGDVLPAAVEMNTLINAGLYACNVERLVEALIETPTTLQVEKMIDYAK